MRAAPASLAAALLVLLPGHVVWAQADGPPAAPPVPAPAAVGADSERPAPIGADVKALALDVADDFLALPSRPNLVWLAVGSAASLAVHPWDAGANRHLAGGEGTHDFFLAGNAIGLESTQAAAAVGTWLIGRLAGRPAVAGVGRDLIRANVLSGALTVGLKLSARRERPDGSDNLSFPSGHASLTFAAATVLERDLGWRYGVPACVLASYVAASRLHDNRHFLSDVVFGAAVGVISGCTATRHTARRTTVAPAFVRGGIGIVAVRTSR